MQPVNTKTLGVLVLAAALGFAGAASAEEGPSPAALLTDGVVQEEVLSLEDLDQLAGGDGVEINMLTAQTLTAINTGNKVIGQTVTSGDLNIGANAFSGFDGVGNFVLNTGHNNNLQSALNISIVLAP
jgi:hypothetical protein